MKRGQKIVVQNKFAEPDLKILSDAELRVMWDKWHGVKSPLVDCVSRKDVNGEPIKLRKHREMQFMISEGVASWDLDYGYAVRPGYKFLEAENLWKQYCRYEFKREQAEKNQIDFSKSKQA